MYSVDNYTGVLYQITVLFLQDGKLFDDKFTEVPMHLYSCSKGTFYVICIVVSCKFIFAEAPDQYPSRLVNQMEAGVNKFSFLCCINTQAFKAKPQKEESGMLYEQQLY